MATVEPVTKRASEVPRGVRRVWVQTARGGDVFDFATSLTVKEAATAAALSLGYRMSLFTLAEGGVAFPYDKKVGDVLKTDRDYELSEVGGAV